MRHRKLCMILFLSLSGCAPKAPPVETCILEVPKDKDLEAYEFDSLKAHCTTSEGYELLRNIFELNKYVCMSSEDALSYITYCESK